MQRTQIYLPKQQIQILQKEARKRDTTVSAIIRLYLAQKIPTKTATQKPKHRLLETARKIHALGEPGPRDLAKNVDKYLYGGI